VLGLTPRASWAEVARTADALLVALEAGDPTAASYDTPLGPQPRTAGAVLVARARLRDPDERIQQEIWWEAPRRPAAPDPVRSVARPHVTASSCASALAPADDASPSWPHAHLGVHRADRWPYAPAAWGWRSR